MIIDSTIDDTWKMINEEFQLNDIILIHFKDGKRTYTSRESSGVKVTPLQDIFFSGNVDKLYLWKDILTYGVVYRKMDITYKSGKIDNMTLYTFLKDTNINLDDIENIHFKGKNLPLPNLYYINQSHIIT